MAAATTAKIYDDLAPFYDQIFGGGRADLWQGARNRLLKGILAKVRSACDLGCGTGATALDLARSGFDVIAVDLSPAMCRVTRQKARQARLPIRVLCADMRKLQLPAPVDLVVCEYSVFNHLSSPRDLLRAARSVARALRPGGTLLFDVTHRSSYEKRWAGSWWGEGPGLFAARQGGYDRPRRMGWVEIIWFSRAAKHWERHSERMEMREWRRSEVQHALKAAGFTHIKAHDGAQLFAGEHVFLPGDKTFFVAERGAAATKHES